MAFIEKHTGCPLGDQVGTCFGPSGEFYTIFGVELRYLTFHFIFSIVIGLGLLVALIILKKKGKISLPNYAIYLISLLTIIILFFLFVLLFPVKVGY
ncbi:MAG: hypothetical protein ACP5N3_01015 [Candidatus Nanoarchaeia archaeon]